MKYIKEKALGDRGGGLIFETDGDACRLAQGCKFWILVLLRVFLAKRQYFKPPRSRLGFREETKNSNFLFSSFFSFLSGLFQGQNLLMPHPNGLLQGLNSKFPTSIPVCSIQESSPPGPPVPDIFCFPLGIVPKNVPSVFLLIQH